MKKSKNKKTVSTLTHSLEVAEHFLKWREQQKKNSLIPA